MRWQGPGRRDRSAEQRLTASYGPLELSGGALWLGEPRWPLCEPGVRLDPAGVTGWNSTGPETTPWAKLRGAQVTLPVSSPAQGARGLWSGLKVLVSGPLTAANDGLSFGSGGGGDSFHQITVELTVLRWERVMVAMQNWDNELTELEQYAPQRLLDVLLTTPDARAALGNPAQIHAVLVRLWACRSEADIDAHLATWGAEAP